MQNRQEKSENQEGAVAPRRAFARLEKHHFPLTKSDKIFTKKKSVKSYT